MAGLGSTKKCPRNVKRATRVARLNAAKARFRLAFFVLRRDRESFHLTVGSYLPTKAGISRHSLRGSQF